MPTLLNTQTEVAFALGTTPQNVGLYKQKGCPHLKRAPFHLEKVQKWIEENIDSTKASRGKTADRVDVIDRTKEANAKIKELTARCLEWEANVTEGKLVEVSKWEEVLNRQAEAFRRELSNIENAADRLLGLETRDEIAAALRKIINETLDRLHKGD
jgi:hypothetical protein